MIESENTEVRQAMKKLASLALLGIMSVTASLPAMARDTNKYQPLDQASRRAEKKQDKAYRKAARKQEKAEKKMLRAQMKGNSKYKPVKPKHRQKQ